jgi:hypothetical protein
MLDVDVDLDASVLTYIWFHQGMAGLLITPVLGFWT